MGDQDLRQFDYDTISDVVLHLKYTARNGGGRLRKLLFRSLENSSKIDGRTFQPPF
jgi:hypothetical protein